MGVTGLVLVVSSLVGLLVAGTSAALGLLAGVGLVLASYVASTVAIAWADSVHPRMVLGVGMGTYITKFTIFGLVLVAVNESGWAGRIPMAIGIVVGVIAWTTSQIWWTLHHPVKVDTSTWSPGDWPEDDWPQPGSRD